ncbi:hypothetical protein QYE76_015397 [Lolium multiflorum]|uniref:SUEL-type lectin domain-containing protein n=1 Tax=Lolium multiflorum TaxID=4521 RepID=A0AAD8WTC3_LOLMU|nr:hypothetical protein QYE76_038131 [Lolium multiflorum]KAK1698700.1 hypothetical protein QYE76_015397 [Lolium multiflorum]
MPAAERDGRKSLTGRNEPSQRFYHVSWSFLKAGAETRMVLFEEASDDPSRVDFHTVADNLEDKCGAYEGGCESKAALTAFEAACVGKESCTVQHTEDFHAVARCDSGVLTVQAVCRGRRGRTRHHRRDRHSHLLRHQHHQALGAPDFHHLEVGSPLPPVDGGGDMPAPGRMQQWTRRRGARTS